MKEINRDIAGVLGDDAEHGCSHLPRDTFGTMVMTKVMGRGRVSKKAAQGESGWAGLCPWEDLVHSPRPEVQLPSEHVHEHHSVHTPMADLSPGVGAPQPVKNQNGSLPVQ